LAHTGDTLIGQPFGDAMSDDALMPDQSPEWDIPVPYIRRTHEWYNALGYGNPYRYAQYAEVPFTAPGKPLSKSLTGAELKTLDEAARLAGLTGAQLNIFRPWFAALTISNAAITRAGYDPMSGVDSKIEKAFAARGIKPKGLETAELQIKVFAGMTSEQELRYLRETIEEYEAAPVELDKMVDQWSKGDIAGMEEMFVTEMKVEEPDLYAALLTNRNASWVTRIEGILAGSGVSFMAVGAGHLIGPDSVVAMLAAKGIVAERVQ
jgi:uncharacterized protein YbaP (TraB family)